MSASSRRGFVFSLDALSAVIVISISVLSIYLLSESSRPEASKYQYLSAISRDVITILEKTKVSEAQSIPIIAQYISSGAIKQEDLEKRLVDVVGSFYASGNSSAAGLIMQGVFSEFLPSRLYYQISIDNETILENGASYSSSLSTRAIISGYQLGKPTSGYISRAWLGTARGNFTDIIEISPLGSGFSSAYSSTYGNLTFNKYFNLSSTDNLTATLYISAHEDGGWIFPFVNGALQEIPSGNNCYHPTDACYDRLLLDSSDFVAGENELKITFGTPGDYHTHTHPGMLLILNYNDDRETNFIQSKDVAQRIDITPVQGRPAAWEVLPFFIPADAVINNISVFVKGEGVDRRGEVWVNEDRIWYERSNNCPSCIAALNNNGITLDITDEVHQNDGISTGETNTLAIYFDIPGSGSGEDYPVTGATGFANISRSSYLFVNYTIPNPIVEYNKIPYTVVFEIGTLDGQGDALEKSVNYTIPSATLLSAFYHDVQKYSCKIAVAAWMPPEEHEPNGIGQATSFKWSNYQIFKSPTVRAIPSTVYIPLPRMRSGGLNALKIRDGIQECSTSNYILTNSTVEYTILVPASVPYGDAFSNLSLAQADAVSRLMALLAEYNLTGTPASDTANIAGISWLWGPSELRVVIGI